MSTEIQKTDLSAVCVGLVAESISAGRELVEAADAAKYALSIVVTDETSKQQAVEQSIKLSRGRRWLEGQRTNVTSKLRAAERAVNEYVAGHSGPMVAAEKYLDAQVLAHTREQQAAADRARRQEEERRIAEEKRLRDAERASREAALAGQPEPVSAPAPLPSPTRYVEPVQTQTKVAGGSAHVHFTLGVELHNVHEVPDHLLILSPTARAWALRELELGEVVLAKRDGNSVVHHGVRLTYTAGLAKR